MKTISNYPLTATAGSAYSYGWQVMKKYFMPLFLITLLVAILESPMGIFNDMDHIGYGISIFTNMFAIAFALFVMAPIMFGADYLFVKAARDEKFEVKDVFDGFKDYLNVVLAALLSWAIIGIGFVFLIIPGIVFACRLAFVPYLVMDKKLDPVKAVEESWRLTRGHGWRIFWMYIVAFFLVIGGLICLVFGVFISVIWISAAFASLYNAVLEENGELEPEVVTPQVTEPVQGTQPTTDEPKSDEKGTKSSW